MGAQQRRSINRVGTYTATTQKLQAIEVDWYREKDSYVREIRRLRAEVGILTKRFNGARKEIQYLVTVLKAQPPPAVPKREGVLDREEMMLEDGEGDIESEGEGERDADGERDTDGQEAEVDPRRSMSISESETSEQKPLEGTQSSEASEATPVQLGKPVKPNEIMSPARFPGGFMSESPTREMGKVRLVNKRSTIDAVKAIGQGATMWRQMAMGFFESTGENKDSGGYAAYSGEVEWESRIIAWAKKKGVEVTIEEMLCWMLCEKNGNGKYNMQWLVGQYRKREKVRVFGVESYYKFNVKC